MMRELATMCLVVALSGLAVGATGEPEPAAKSSGCNAKLGSNVYSCSVIASDGTSFTDCLRFTASGVVSDFDVTPDQLGIPLGCVCKASGSKKHPKFGGAPSFQCSGRDYTFEGTVSGNGKAISKGLATTSAGASYAYSCKLSTSCAIQ